MKGKRLQLARILCPSRSDALGLEELAQLAETTVEIVASYAEQGLLGEEIQKGRAHAFGEVELYLVRRIEQLRVEYGVPSEAAGMILDLAARVEELENEIRSLREGMGR